MSLYYCHFCFSPCSTEVARQNSTIRMLLNFPVICSANYWDTKVLKGKGYRVSILRRSPIWRYQWDCVSASIIIPSPSPSYIWFGYVYSYVQNTCPHACPTVSANCWHVLSIYMWKTRVLENNLSGKHWWLFSNLGLLHQEQLALCQGQKHQLDIYKLTGDLFWVSLLQKQNENSQGACVSLQINRPPFKAILLCASDWGNLLRFAKLSWLGVFLHGLLYSGENNY